MADEADRTEAASPRRRQRAREEGQVALSREVAPAAVLAASALMLLFAAPALSRDMLARLVGFLAEADRLDPFAALWAAARLVVLASLPFAGVAAIASAVSVFAQTGLLLRLEALRPSVARLSPWAGLVRLAGGATLAETGRALLKLGFVASASWFVLAGAARDAVDSLAWPPALVLGRVLHVAAHLVLVVMGAQMLLALLDVVRARLALSRSLRMSRHEVREEHREAEGDPQIKARIRRLRSQRARRRMMAAVPRATVVVTNPTHYAIALSYERGSAGAPRVVAKGVDAMAARIRETAQQARVPLIANPPLARALWRIELDDEVPAELFQAVAEVIAVVWRMRAPRRGP